MHSDLFPLSAGKSFSARQFIFIKVTDFQPTVNGTEKQFPNKGHASIAVNMDVDIVFNEHPFIFLLSSKKGRPLPAIGLSGCWNALQSQTATLCTRDPLV